MTFPSRKDIENVARDVLRAMNAPTGGGGGGYSPPSESQAQWTPSASRSDDGPRGSELVSEKDVRAAKARGDSVLVAAERTLVTPLARDAAYECGIEIRIGSDPATNVVATPQSAGSPGGPARVSPADLEKGGGNLLHGFAPLGTRSRLPEVAPQKAQPLGRWR